MSDHLHVHKVYSVHATERGATCLPFAHGGLSHHLELAQLPSGHVRWMVQGDAEHFLPLDVVLEFHEQETATVRVSEQCRQADQQSA